MKKISLILLSLISTVCFAVSTPLFFASAKADSQSVIKTDTFLPSSTLQLYDLKSPVCVSYSESGFMVIAEHIGDTNGGSIFDRISVYNPNTKKFGAISSHQTIYNVTHAQEYNGFIFYLSNSHLYYVSADNLDQTPIETSVTSSNFFYIKGNYLITNTNNSIVIYSLSVNSNAIEFTKKSTHNFTTKNAFISQEENVYYLYGGKLYCFDTQSSTSYEVATVPVDVNYMTELENFVYFTSSNGLYKVEKGKDKKIEQVIATSDGNYLGNIKNPQGITVMDNQLLIADPDLKCIQGVDASSGKFTDFAITIESTADFRLTNNASKLSISENYAYVLDDGASDADGNVYKRIVKIALDKTVSNRYTSYNLKNLYNENGEFNLKYFACSDTHIAIYQDNALTLYEIKDGALTIAYSFISESITSLYYLDGEFYYTDYALHNFEHNAVNVHKITLPTEDNQLESVTASKINCNTVIKGVALNACVDVFGNTYIINDAQDGSSKKLIKISNGDVTEISNVSHSVTSIKVDFAGNVYLLSNDNKIFKYSFDGDNLTVNEFIFDASPVKDIELNYVNNVCYALSNSCILKTVDDVLQIENLSQVSAIDVNASSIITTPKFITVSENGKLFKVTIDNFDQDGNFNDITPISNPNPDKVYLVVSELENYYLVSNSEKLVALVSKSTATYAPELNFSSAIIEQSYYPQFNIDIVDGENKKFTITNKTSIFSKPLFDNHYKINTLSAGDEVYEVKTVKYNGIEMTLLADKDSNLLGYVVSGYLTDGLIQNSQKQEVIINVASSNGSKHFNTVLMITIIALTVTLVLLFIEKKLLFDKEDNNANN